MVLCSFISLFYEKKFLKKFFKNPLAKIKNFAILIIKKISLGEILDLPDLLAFKKALT